MLRLLCTFLKVLILATIRSNFLPPFADSVRAVFLEINLCY